MTQPFRSPGRVDPEDRQPRWLRDVPPDGAGPGTAEEFVPAWAEVDLAAIEWNVALLAEVARPAQVCAVVKADGYGHGAVPVARAALAGGATWLAVAQVAEGLALRGSGITAPILLLSEVPPTGCDRLVAAGLTPTVCRAAVLERLSLAAAERGAPVGVHLKVDTGMHRMGASPEDAVSLVERAVGDPFLRYEGLWTHLSVAESDSPADRSFTERQLVLFEGVRRALEERGFRAPLHHVANSAAAIAVPPARYQLVRCGLSVYGELPSASVGAALAEAAPGRELRPALTLAARVTAVRTLRADGRPSYGRRRSLPAGSVVATVPVGYADGIPRRLFDGGYEVLIGGRRRALAGTVTMDQLVVDCGTDSGVAVGDEVVLIGSQGGERVAAGEVAERLGTITWEVLTGVGPRVPRRLVGSEAGRADVRGDHPDRR